MTHLALLAKFWLSGQVKTRLAPALGAERAALLHRLFLETLLSRFCGLADRRTLLFTPLDRRDDFAALTREHWELAPQAEGDLGDRMRDAFERAFAAGATRVVLIGADSPTLPAAFLEQAFAALSDSPVALGPASDGGYYLVGAAHRPPPIFADIAWGASTVWQQTQDRLAAAACPCHHLPEWYDIDTPADLRRLRTELAVAGLPEFLRLRSALEDLLR